VRRPTPRRELYKWHTSAILGGHPEIHDGDPQCGWYRTRLVKGGPYVPAVIWCHQPVDQSGRLTDDEVFKCKIYRKVFDPMTAWTWLAHDPITESAYLYLYQKLEWAAIHEPDSPEANPDFTIQWGKIAPHRFTKEQDND